MKALSELVNMLAFLCIGVDLVLAVGSSSVSLMQEGKCPCWSTGWRCINDCYGRPNGDYQSCRCCHGDRAYITCFDGQLYYRSCPPNLFWSDEIKQCYYTSTTCRECLWPPPTTCPCRSTGRNCVGDCKGRADGDYQSCRCCHGSEAYVSCSGGILYYRPCPANLVWTDDLKICNYTSNTCHECLGSSNWTNQL